MNTRVAKLKRAETSASKNGIEEQLKFETLLFEISARFVNLPADRIDSEIENAQRRICESLDLDRSSLLQVSEEEPGALLLTHFHRPPGSPLPPERMNARDFFPWSSKNLLEGKTLIISNMAELPPEAHRDLETFQAFSTKSTVQIPLSVGDAPIFGVAGFAVIFEKRTWTETDLKRFKVIAQVFANALARKCAEQALTKRLQFEQMLSDLSARFLAVPFDQVDREIEIALEQIREFLQVDRCALLELHKDTAAARLTHDAIVEGVEPVSGEINLAELYPWLYKQLLEGKHINLYRVEDYPEDALKDRQSHEAMHIKSALVIPLPNTDRILRTIVVNCVRLHRIWPEEYVPRLRLLGEIFVNALERRDSRMKLEDELRFEMLLAEITSRFVNLSADQVDGEIEEAQRRVCKCLGLDISVLWQSTSQTPNVLYLAHSSRPVDVPERPQPTYAHEFFPWCQRQLEEGRIIAFSSRDEFPAEAARDRESVRLSGIKSILVFPLSEGGGPLLGALAFNAMQAERAWPEPLIQRLQLVARIFTNALARKRMDEQLKEQLREIGELKQQLERENIYLQGEIKLLTEHTEIVGQSSAMKNVLAHAEQVARTDSTVLLLGETGTGKELLARVIHSMSSRKDRPLVTVNCAALPPTLIESELFGREKGAYTGAMTRMVGRFEIADGSTLFLDEIGELPVELQIKLLRVLEEGSFERLGSTKALHVNVRIIAATNRDIEQEVKDGKFRRDLFYRLNVFPIVIPPLRERPEDIPLLVRTIVKEFQKKMGKEIETIPRKTMQALQSYSWPGNVRELRNLIEHAMILCRGKSLEVHVPKHGPSHAKAAGNLEDMERMHIAAVLEKTGWRIAGQGGAAEILGMKRTTLQAKIKRLSIKRSNSTVRE